MTNGVSNRTRLVWRQGPLISGQRVTADELPVALTYDGATHAVMMASPTDLEDFAIGFSLTEGIIEHVDDIIALDIVRAPQGWIAHLHLVPRARAALDNRRRRLTGAVGCGLCGLESLEEVVKPARSVPATGSLPAAALTAALVKLQTQQPLGDLTRAVHAAGFLAADGTVSVREDVGRHNALDKIIGTIARHGQRAADGALLLTSRVSVELVQKAAMVGCPILAAISAPTSQAVDMADQAGMTLVAVARSDGFEIFTHAHRICDVATESAYVA